jgi:predicted O-methyltransferase YrrM
MYPNDPIFSKLTQVQIDRIYYEKFLIASLIQPKVMIEIGVRTGYSAIAFFKAVPDLIYYGFDCSDKKQAGDKKYLEHAKRITKGYNFILKEVDTLTLENLGITDVDLVSIDGNHTYKYVYNDLVLAWEAVKSRGFLLLDDISYIKDVKKALIAFRENYYLFKLGRISYLDFKGLRGFSLIQIIKNDI